MALKHTSLLGSVAAFFGLMLAGCQPLPSIEQRPSSSALPIEQARDTQLGRAIDRHTTNHPGTSGLHLLEDPGDAFAARALLARAAERTLDVQYYIWKDDLTGTLLLQSLHEAAGRGVRVRLLLDDLGNALPDTTLAILDAHPNIQVRLFNPFRQRRLNWLGFVTDFSRVNRRMHNKSFTADNQVTIIGGRNVADQYFGATDGTLFSDLDVLAVGPVVQELSEDFDAYWASASAYPVDRLFPARSAEELVLLDAEAERVRQLPAAAHYIEELEDSHLIQALLNERLVFVWADTRLLSDDPAKGLGQIPREGYLLNHLAAAMQGNERSLNLVSAYFVPSHQGARMLTELADKGVKINVLTNSLAATDVALVYSGYAKRRKPLLKAGITLYEMRAEEQNIGPRDNPRPFSSSSTSLHAKTLGMDGETFFIGSFNFDPRSAVFNTELGFLIDSPEIATALQHAFEQRIPERAYQVHLGEDGDLFWTSRQDGQTHRYEVDPKTSWLKRLAVRFFSLLPIDRLL
ncbi:MAG: phospholipase D family protein [Halothiobacillaceae bacterium]